MTPLAPLFQAVTSARGLGDTDTHFPNFVVTHEPLYLHVPTHRRLNKALMSALARCESEFLLHQTEDGGTRVEARFDGDTAWLSLGQMGALFPRDKSVTSRCVKNVFEEGDLGPEATVAESATVQLEGERDIPREVEYFNLDVLLSVSIASRSLARPSVRGPRARRTGPCGAHP